jgi:hypothetical protein
MDRDSSARSAARFAGCLRVVPPLQTLMVEHTPTPQHTFYSPLHTAARRPKHDGGTPWNIPTVLRVRVCESCPNCVPNAARIHPPCEQCRWESQQCTARLPIHSHAYPVLLCLTQFPYILGALRGRTPPGGKRSATGHPAVEEFKELLENDQMASATLTRSCTLVPERPVCSDLKTHRAAEAQYLSLQSVHPLRLTLTP